MDRVSFIRLIGDDAFSPSPLAGEGWGEGDRRWRFALFTLTLALSHQGRGNATDEVFTMDQRIAGLNVKRHGFHGRKELGRTPLPRSKSVR